MRPELLNTVLILALTAAVVLSGILLRAVGRLRVLADTDPLTGLANRRAFQARLSALEYSGQTVTIASLDLNDLKEVNDARGHPAGDALLRRTADILRAACVPQYRVYRVGGDEFVLLGWQQTPEQADQFLSRLRERRGSGCGPWLVHRPCRGSALVPFDQERPEYVSGQAAAQMLNPARPHPGKKEGGSHVGSLPLFVFCDGLTYRPAGPPAFR